MLRSFLRPMSGAGTPSPRAARSSLPHRHGDARSARSDASSSNFGTTDMAKMPRSRRSRRLSAAKLDAAVDVVLGGSAPHLGELRARNCGAAKVLVSSSTSTSTIWPVLMQAADLAIGAGGVGALERCAIGLPSADPYRGGEPDRQRPRSRCGWCGGLRRSARQQHRGRSCRRLAKGLCGRRCASSDEPRAAAALVDGLGAARVRALCSPPPLAKDGRRVVLRPAVFADAAAMLAWQSAPGARAYAQQSRSAGAMGAPALAWRQARRRRLHLQCGQARR